MAGSAGSLNPFLFRRLGFIIGGMKTILALSFAVLFASSLAAEEVPVDAAGYSKTVAPFLKKYCGECHTGEKPRGSSPSTQLG